MENWQTDFPKSDKKYLQAKDFQDRTLTLTYRSYAYKANEDYVKDGVVKESWKDRLKFQLRYSYPQMAIDTNTGEQRLDKNGKPFQNSNWKPEYPHGYTIVYKFDEGLFESGSNPVWEEFKMLSPRPGEKIQMGKTGQKEGTVWTIRVLGRDRNDVPDLQIESDPLDSTEFPTE